LELAPVAAGFHQAGFGPKGDLWAVINGSRMLTSLRAPGAVNTRWVTEDVPYGLVTWSALGEVASVPTPMIDATVTLASAVLATDFRRSGRHLADLGLDQESVAGIVAYVTGA